VVVITGASSGIGRATARHLARHGAHLVLAARRAEVLEEVARECQELGGRAIPVPTDVTDAAALERLAEGTVARFGRIDAWFNNAGVLLLAPFEQAPPAEIRRLLDTDLLGTMHGSQAALRRFRAQGHGILINTGSMLGIVGEPYAGVYAAAKAGIRTLGLCLRQELRDQPAIRVCTLLPMAMDTPVFRRAANYTGREVKAVLPVYDPDLVAKTVLALIHRPRDEVIVGGFGRLLNLGRHLAPGLVEAAIARLGPRLQLGAKPAPPSPGNLFAPARDGWRRRGGWAALPLHPARQWHLATAGLLAALAAGTLLARRGHGHASPERSEPR
jgi:NADP-dependent 3-hydroxy acid dehydrogenase YdfG